MIVEIEKSTRKRRSSRISDRLEQDDVRIESCLNVEPKTRSILDTVELGAQLEHEIIPSKLSGEISSENYTPREEFLIGVDRGLLDSSPITMDGDRGLDPPLIPPIPPIDPLVRPRGLPIVVPQNLQAVDIPSHLPKFYGTKNEDPSRHMERLANSLVINPGYWLMWFPTTLEGEAYEWYRDHAQGHFRGWNQLQREFLNEFRPEVGQSTALRALASLKQGREVEDFIRIFRRMKTLRRFQSHHSREE